MPRIIHGNEVYPYFITRLSRGAKKVRKIHEEVITSPERAYNLIKYLLDYNEMSPFEHLIIEFKPGENEILEPLLKVHPNTLKDDYRNPTKYWVNARVILELIKDKHPFIKATSVEKNELLLLLRRMLPSYHNMLLGESPSQLMLAKYYEKANELLNYYYDYKNIPSILGFFNWEPTFYTFLFKVTRVTSHQMVRHRTISWIQKSDRFTEPGFDTNILYFLDRYPQEVRDWLLTKVSQTFEDYYFAISNNMTREDARFLLPQITTTYLWGTAHINYWKDFIEKRSSKTAQLEIRLIAEELSRIIP